MDENNFGSFKWSSIFLNGFLINIVQAIAENIFYFLRIFNHNLCDEQSFKKDSRVL
jgi:hypothetical protein